MGLTTTRATGGIAKAVPKAHRESISVEVLKTKKKKKDELYKRF